MLRRSHTKSRAGCVQCKRRHVKCDEGRPACRLCVNSQRECSFVQLGTNPSLSQSPIAREVHAARGSSAAPSSLSGPVPPHLLNLIARNTAHDAAADEPVNYAHMELLIHALTAPEMYNLGAEPSSEYMPTLLLALSISLEYQFLLHEILAFSAGHLARIHPARAAFYQHQSIALQTQALTLFNASWSSVTAENCVAILLFSSVLAHHLLGDTLGKRDAADLEAWLGHYVACIETHRGIYTIAESAWPLLMASDIAPVLSASQRFTSRAPTGVHCERAGVIIAESTRLSDVEREACVRAVRYLQVGFDAVAEGGEGRFHMIFTWTMLASVQFTGLLKERRPEALVLLGYYAWLLHCGREQWQVGDAGVYVLGLVEGYLGGGEWAECLERPRREVEKTK